MAIITNIKASEGMSPLEAMARRNCEVTRDDEGFPECKCLPCTARNKLESMAWSFADGIGKDSVDSGISRGDILSDTLGRMGGNNNKGFKL